MELLIIAINSCKCFNTDCMADKKYILSKEVTEKKLRRMALQVAEQNYEEPKLVLIGIKENGLVIAHIICAYLAEVYTGEIIVVELTLNKKNPAEIMLSPVIDYNGK